MTFPWEFFDYLEAFFRLDFLFTGLEVNTIMVFIARLIVFVVFGGGALFVIFKVSVKLLECVQALLSSIGLLPGTFYLLILLVIPLSPNSLISNWIGYILLTICALCVSILALLSLALWKYGVERVVSMIRTMRSEYNKEPSSAEDQLMDPDNVIHTSTHEISSAAGKA